MKKQKINLFDYLSFLFLILILVGFLYGGLTINKLVKANQELTLKQNSAQEKIALLEQKISDNQNQILTLDDSLKQNQKMLSYYRKLAIDAQAKLNDTNTQTPATETVNPIIPAVKTITKKVYVETPKSEATLTIEGMGSYKVPVTSGDTAFTILKKAASQYGLKIAYDSYSFGVFITEIAGLKPVGNQYWAFYYNGKFSQVGAADQNISVNDTIYWRLESF